MVPEGRGACRSRLAGIRYQLTRLEPRGQGKILPVILQLLFHKGRLAMHGKKIENYIQSDFD